MRIQQYAMFCVEFLTTNLVRVVQSYGSPVQSPDLLRARLTRIVQSIRPHKVDNGAEYAEDKAWVEANDVDGNKRYEHNDILP